MAALLKRTSGNCGKFNRRSNLKVVHYEEIRQSSFDPVVNIIRADLAYAAGGAAFGANYSNPSAKAISIDKSLVKLLENAPPSTTPSGVIELRALQPIVNYSRFRELFGPKAALDH